MEGLRLEDGEYGRLAVVTSALTHRTIDYLAANAIPELELNYAKGWRGTDLSFLRQLPHLQALTLLDFFQIPRIEPIISLQGLRKLNVQTYDNAPIDFSNFPRLEDCSLEWRPNSQSLFACTRLRRLFLNRYKAKNVDAFSKLRNLEWLCILNAPITDFFGLRTLKGLRYLRLGNLPRISSLAGIESLENLEELNVNTCRRIRSIQEVGSLTRLRKFHLSNCGEIASLKPLDSLSGLEWVTFIESTNIRDGDISPVWRQRNLTRVSFQNRRHYSHRRQDFGPAYYGEELWKQIQMGVRPQSVKELVRQVMEQKRT